MCTVLITPLLVNIFQVLFALLCSWCFFGVVNDCLNDYMREFAKVAFFSIIACVRTSQKLPGTGPGGFDFIAN